MLILLKKCNGVKPCNTCSKRGSSCTYGESGNESDDQPCPKRRITEHGGSAAASPVNGPPPPVPQQFNISSPNLQPPYAQNDQSQEVPQWTLAPPGHLETQDIHRNNEARRTQAPPEPVQLFSSSTQDPKKDTVNSVDQTSHLLSRGSTVNGQDEEAVVYSNTRMLQDPTGRLRKTSLPAQAWPAIHRDRGMLILMQCMLEIQRRCHFCSSFE